MSSKSHLGLPPPKVLDGRDIPSLAKYIKSNTRCRNIIFMLGAGVSTSAGIPDFRSPDTGLYANLHHLNLPTPEAVFDIEFFKHNPKPFYVLAKELRPGKFRPTLTHSFVQLIHEKGLLLKCFTQNIDTLERRAGIPDDKLVEAHGSFASQRCIRCKRPYDDDKMAEAFEQQKFATCPKCHGLVKPDIVFFGESLPARFVGSLDNFPKADLLIIIGTSLTVFPFARLVEFTHSNCPRVFINLERVMNFHQRGDDVVLLGKCDAIIEQLCKELGWYDDLLQLWAETGIKDHGPQHVKPATEEVEELAEAINKVIRLDEDVTGEKLRPDLTPSDPSKPSIHAEDETTKEVPKPGPEPDPEAPKSEKPAGESKAIQEEEGDDADAEGEEEEEDSVDVHREPDAQREDKVDTQETEEDKAKSEGKL
ncbi:Sir2 family histone deacetylase Hst2 [Amanita muscaria]